MGSPSDGPPERVDLGKDHPSGSPSSEQPDESFDPYRFGAPDVPPPPEYAPPGYRPPPGYQHPTPASETPHGPYPPYPYGTTTGGGNPNGPYNPSPYGPPPYGQSPYGAPDAAAQGNGKAVAALVLGIVSIAFFWTTVFDAVFVILALIFGFLGLSESRRRGGRGRGQALAGLICAAIGAVLAVVFFVFLVHLANKCGGLSNQNDSDFQHCLRDQIS